MRDTAGRQDDLFFAPVDIESTLPDPSSLAWPMGDVLASEPLPPELDQAMIAQAVDAVFEPAAGMTAAFVVTHKGRVIGERCAPGITVHTPLESWSMGKSLTATLIIPSHDLVVVRQGHYRGAREGRRGLRNALTLLMKAVPATQTEQ